MEADIKDNQTTPQMAATPHRFQLFMPVLKYKLAIFLIVVLGSCAPKLPQKKEIRKESWKILPRSTSLNKRTQFVISGKNLFAAEVITGESVKVEKGPVTPDGRTLKLWMTIGPLNQNPEGENMDPLDDPGTRKIQVRTLEDLKQMTIYMVDEDSGGLR